MIPTLLHRLRRCAGPVQALVSGHWHLLLSETRLNAGEAAKHSRTAAAGAAAVLVGFGLFMAGLSLLLALALVRWFDLSPLAAATISTLALAAACATTGWLLVRSGSAGLKSQPVAPARTLDSLRNTVTHLSQPNYNIAKTPMNPTDPESPAGRAVDAAAEQIHHARRGLADMLYSVGEKLDPNPLIASASKWIDSLGEPDNRRRLAQAFAAAATLPRRFPAPAALIGAGIGYLAWEAYLRRRESPPTEFADNARSLARRVDRAVRDEAADLRESAASVRANLRNLHDSADAVIHRWSDAARETGATVRDAARDAATRTARSAADLAERTRENVATFANGAAEAGHRLADDARVKAEKAAAFAKERPLLTLAGVFALGAAAASLLRPRK